MVGEAAENIISDGMGLDKIGKKYRCPNRSAHAHGDRNPSMSFDSKALQFLCFTCGEKIDIYSYYRAQGFTFTEMLQKHGLLEEEFDDISDSELKINSKELTEAQFEYLQKRGISRVTADSFNLGNVQENIIIPYFNSKGILTAAKVKNLKSQSPKYFSVKGSNFGLFNKQNLTTREPLIITEGEFDSMIVHQCGFTNVSSVGTGANSLEKLFKVEGDFLKKFPGLIVISDNDTAGQGMEQAFLKEFNLLAKLPDKTLFKNVKDLNDVFLKYGKGQIEAIINSATRKIEGLRNLDEEPYKGLGENTGVYIPTGLSSIDYAINDLGPGILTLVTGRSNGGKSTLINQILASAIDRGYKCFLIAGEGLQDIIINNIYKAAIGRDQEYYEFVKINKRLFKEPKPHVLLALREWHKGKLVIFNKGDSKLKTTEELLFLIEEEIKTAKPNLVVVDNLMSVLSIEKAAEKYEKQGDFAQRLADIAKAYNLHIMLVLHPNKTVSKGSEMDFEQISGSADLYNKADIILAVKREYDNQKLEQGIDGQISVLKNRYFSNLTSINTHFDQDTGLLLEIEEITGNHLGYAFKWRQFLKDSKPKDKFNIPEGFSEVEGAKQLNWDSI
jgi:twinkle protein